MPQNIPTTKQIKENNLANYESELSQTSPAVDKAFLKVQSSINAMNFTQLYKYGVERTLQNLVLTASGDGLDLLGNNRGVVRKPAESAVLEIELPGTNGTVIPITTDFIGDSNGERYFLNAPGLIGGGVAVLDVTAENSGVSGNLNLTDILNIGTQIPGAESQATVTDILNLGVEKETDDAYRIRILDVLRSQGGGSNSADFRIWAQAVAGVARAFPYSGNPDSLELNNGSAVPPERTVFVEADTGIDPDGIAPSGLLDDVRDALNTDPETGLSRQGLGLTDETLFVESITRIEFFVRINNLDIALDQEAQVKTDIETALTQYFLSLNPYVDGLDPIFTRNDLITDLTISDVVQDVLSAAGGSADSLIFGTSFPTSLFNYRLSPGEKAKAGSITYV